jgi:hypothetical protein
MISHQMQMTRAAEKAPAPDVTLPARSLEDAIAAPAHSDKRISHQTQYPRVHELAHALGLGYGQYGRDKAEVLVDCVTYVVCSSVGLDVGGESIPYVAGWGEDGALDAIREYAETVDAIARRIEDALGDGAAVAVASVQRAA